MFMRLQGYPPDKIAILTTYNGQKHLIRDVLAKRCARNPVFGLPEKVGEWSCVVCITSVLRKVLFKKFSTVAETIGSHTLK